MLPTVNAAVIRERRDSVEIETMIDLIKRERETVLKMHKQGWLLHKQDLVQLSKCMMINQLISQA